MANPHRLASCVLVGRPSMAIDTITELLDRSEYARQAPIFAFYLPGSLSGRQRESLKRISKSIEILEVSTPLPRFRDKEMFYSRTNKYAKRFSKNRIGYLDMCFWRSNLFFESRLNKFDFVLSFDDDSEFLRSPDPYIGRALDESGWIIATADAWNHVTQRQIDTREELFDFTKDYVMKFQVTVSDPALASALAENSEESFHGLNWSIGNFNLYRMAPFRSLDWYRWIYSVNVFGGAHRFRWGDIETLGVFGRLVSDSHLLNLGMVSDSAYSSPRDGARMIKRRWKVVSA